MRLPVVGSHRCPSRKNVHSRRSSRRAPEVGSRAWARPARRGGIMAGRYRAAVPSRPCPSTQAPCPAWS
ncbi:hypothetical protein LA76x_3040 [Lysobacter antibioticus]|uniref:Uncharacterized protein n=1 Tax=Lysobacter antibioticus TaxID=84531 RepID=A0A0S2FCC8_LYSAN|nr:hypothetical protein LA76x_3040 [Lysobacter antibioticus]